MDPLVLSTGPPANQREDRCADTGPVGEARDSSALRNRPGALASRFATDGYLLLRKILDPFGPAAAAAHFASVLGSAGWVGHDLAPSPGFASRLARPPVAARQLYRALYSGPSVHSLGHEAALVDVLCDLLGPGPLLVHPRPGCRTVFPLGDDGSGDDPTPAHQDHVGMQGTPNACTAWIPLAACGREAGPLAVAIGSHLGGARGSRPRPGARVAPCDEDGLDGRFVTADFEPGDVLVFHSLTVHKALPNRSGRVRISVDRRYQRAVDPVCEASLGADLDLTWEDVYRDWGQEQREALGYYWHSLDLDVVAHDPSRLDGN